MDSLNTNLYPSNSTNKDDIFGGYIRNSCAQQPQRHFLPPFAMPMSNNMSQPLMYNTQNQPIYNIMYTHQSMYRNQNTFSTFPQESWQTTNEYKDKYENRNDCCLETKNFYNYNKNSLLDPNWYYGANYESQKYTELPSCSQVGSDCNIVEKVGKSVKYCSIQKLPEVDPKLNHCPKPYENLKEYSSCSQYAQPYNSYASSTCLEQIDKKTCLLNPNLETQYEFIDVSAKPIEKIEENGNESDIIVENSEEESDESDLEKEGPTCLVCHLQVQNMSYFDITLEKTVTSHTRTRVSEKLFQILGWIPIEKRSKLICKLCMSLLNNLDSLEKQSNSIKLKIMDKYKKSDITTNFLVDNLKKPKKYLKKQKNYSFRCPFCKKNYSFTQFYKHHLATHKNKTYFCRNCKIKFKTLLQLRTHYAKKHFNTPKLVERKRKKTCFMCYLCGKCFKSTTNLMEHENMCSGNLPFECTLCKKRFPSVTKMKQHIKFHEKDFKFICECGKGFLKNCDYKKHLLSHSANKSFKCSMCGNLYKTLSNLNQHKKSHEKTLPFICEICNKGFLRKELLDSHFNTHSGTRPFKCNICDKSFTMQKYLNAHVKTHDGTCQKKICNVCGKQIKNNFDKHMRLHSSVKSFECLQCGAKFLTKGALSKHIKRKHQIIVL